MALVELRDITKIYHLGGEKIRALDGVSLDIESGEMISIIGPSGSGKSTLMHIIGCLDSPTSGSIQLDGTMIHNASPRKLAKIRNQNFCKVLMDEYIEFCNGLLSPLTQLALGAE
jgi:putative ABC transport system ATP-binding protein